MEKGAKEDLENHIVENAEHVYRYLETLGETLGETSVLRYLFDSQHL